MYACVHVLRVYVCGHARASLYVCGHAHAPLYVCGCTHTPLYVCGHTHAPLYVCGHAQASLHVCGQEISMSRPVNFLVDVSHASQFVTSSFLYANFVLTLHNVFIVTYS